MTTKLQDFVVITVGALVFLALSWSWARAVRRGRPLTAAIRSLLLFGCLFVIGSAYIMMFSSWFAWPTRIWFVLIAAWGVPLVLIAWWWHHRKTAEPDDPTPPEQ